MAKKNSQLPSTSEQILERSTTGATFLMMGQLFTKLVTFILNNLLIRFLSPRIFGITAFLEFIQGTVLFFSRDAIRLSTLRISDSGNGIIDDDDEEEYQETHYKSKVLQTAVNFAYIPFWIGFPLSIGLIAWQYRNINAYFITLPFFRWSIFLIWLSIIVELLSEPFFIVNQFMLNYAARSRFESIAVTTGCIVNFIVVYAVQQSRYPMGVVTSDIDKEGIAILAFALAKLAHSITLLACYYWDYLKNFKPKKLFSTRLTKIKTRENNELKKGYPKSTSYFFQNDILQHFKKVYFQLCFKHLLTEGDKLIINSLCTVEEQGIYALLSNYGSLLTRLLFAPIEESLRLFLARLLSSHNPKNLKLSIEVLVNLTRFYIYLSLMIIVFGPANSSFLLQFLIGSKWSTTSVLDTIRVYCFYIPFLSLNGIFEAFFQSVATGDQILKHSYFMMAFSGIFLLNSWLLIEKLKLSIEGLILSNIINMVLRILYCGVFLNKFHRELFTDSSFFFNFKDFKTVIIAGSTICLLDWWFIGYVKNLQQFVVNVLFAMGLLALILVKERQTIQSFINKRAVSNSKDV
ncbi:BBF_HP2_G0001770.mRNA.1.CDS.1 [Saccharomyces cerevisiae]|nr:BBF_HP2_G0001770.mRNA.1.CDS.1 [Saccharomyces cerevisiae]CAI6389826.1 BBF_HP1_G0001740.mRNA.1.CDS.1 [Saccharomyces cerevisiae]CAI6390205.1 BBF_HP2_G0001770.mRNA.1.CDS.1 [Saccharomyces cerevisiae]CAI7039651.1 BBF_collapsed_G0001720.mRNA.1.CDS.1 [Saccharomyces cerevisiae]